MSKLRILILIYKYAILKGYYSGAYEASNRVRDGRLAKAYAALEREATNAYFNLRR
jgi:hypothetical protein